MEKTTRQDKTRQTRQTNLTRDQAKKKKVIEAVLLELDIQSEPIPANIGMLAGFKTMACPWTVAWYRHRVQFINILYGLTIPELERWKWLRSFNLMDDIALQELQGAGIKLAEARTEGAITAIETLSAAAPKKKARAKKKAKAKPKRAS